ncbi:MAG: AmmeMemoRadiSam system protein B [Spirochaetales bacterium]
MVVREPIAEGLLYPEDPTLLKEQLIHLGMGIPDPPGASLGILTPHAAYDRCGKLLARAFRAVEKRKIQRVILLGAVHREEEESIFLPESTAFRTPLGTLPVDVEIVEELFASGTKLIKNDIPHLEEHCLEVQLPFIAYYFPHVKIIPILLGKPSLMLVHLLSSTLKSVFLSQWDSTLLVITTNGSKIGLEKEVQIQADKFWELVEAKDWKTLVQDKVNKTVGACGAGAVASLFPLFGPSLHFTLLERSLSKDEEEDKRMVYFSASMDVQ